MRDYIHVVDLAEAHLLALDAAKPGTHAIVNLGSGRGYSEREVLLAVAEVTDRDLPIVEAPRRAGDPPTLVAANERAVDLLGWTPSRDLRAMVADAWSFEQRSEPGR